MRYLFCNTAYVYAINNKELVVALAMIDWQNHKDIEGYLKVASKRYSIYHGTEIQFKTCDELVEKYLETGELKKLDVDN